MILDFLSFQVGLAGWLCFLDCKESHEDFDTVLPHPLCLFPGRRKASTLTIFSFFPKEKDDKGETYIQILPHLLCD